MSKRALPIATVFACFTLCSLGNVDVAQAIPWVERAKFTAADAGAGDLFGTDVSLSGDAAIIGAYRNDDGGTDSGSAYVFQRTSSGWVQVTKLLASDAAAGDYFGRTTGISGTYAVIGAPYDDDCGGRSGSAYIFEDNGTAWNQVAKLHASDGAGGDEFGHAIGMSGNKAIVGAHGNDDWGTTSGAAYIFEKSGASWGEAAKLTASDATGYDLFGCSVSISGEAAIVGAQGNDDNGSWSGSAYIFEKASGVWTEVAKLTASDAAAGDHFAPCDISGTRAIIGAWENDDTGSNSGSAYIFEKLGGVWTEVAKLTASDTAPGDLFGRYVSISGSFAIVSAPEKDDNGIDSGAAYIFEDTGSGWVEVAKVTASDAATGDCFGWSVGIDGGIAIVGAYQDDLSIIDAGSAYVYTPIPEPATWGLLSLGIVALMRRRRRR